MKYATYVIAFKLVLRKGNKILLLKKAKSGALDFPGGRVEKNEENFPIKKMFKREIVEEVGKDVKYEILNPVFQYKIFNPYLKINTLITVYEAKYLSGKIKLSEEHIEAEWINPKKYSLKGKRCGSKEGYAAMENYFKNFK